ALQRRPRGAGRAARSGEPDRLRRGGEPRRPDLGRAWPGAAQARRNPPPQGSPRARADASAQASPRPARADESRKAALARSREDSRHVVKLADNLVLLYPAPKTPGPGFPCDVTPGQRRAANRDGFPALRAFDLDVLVILMDAQPKIAALPCAARLGGHDPQVKRALVALPGMRLCHAHGLRAVGL